MKPPINQINVVMTVLALNSLEPAVGRGESGFQPNAGHDYVVLIHGLGRTSWSMKRLEWALERKHYRVVNLDYPSTQLTVQAAAECLEATLNERISDRTARIHFVTHSLGGIVLRQYLSGHQMDNLGRVVMLAPPNEGSELTDKLKYLWLYRFLVGPAGGQLGTDADSVPRRLPPVDFELGIIAGDRSLNPLFSACLPGPDDGKVSVESTRTEGMSDFLVVHHSHTWLASNRRVISATIQFLQTGRFR